jgi:DNA (cytosine-5)-methyltransferase 1
MHAPAVPIDRADKPVPRAAEFFAGVGLVRRGLEAAGFGVVWANDIDESKAKLYRANFAGADHLFVGDVADVTGATLPEQLSLAWASFPCIDLSLAGKREGIDGPDSKTFWEFARILEELGDARPPVVAIENVIGFATSHGGADLHKAIEILNDLDYSVDVLVIDAKRFVPQSRPRLFLVAARDVPAGPDQIESPLRPRQLDVVFDAKGLVTHRAALPHPPAPLEHGLTALLEPPEDTVWWDERRTNAFLESLSPLHLERVKKLQAHPVVVARAAYRRMRGGQPTWEIRPDDIAGCLRTARGGSSRQAVLCAGDGSVRVRWMTPREYGRLMGADGYDTSVVGRNDALTGFGDAVCVPVVTWLAENYLLPLVDGAFAAEPLVATAG